MSHPLRTLVFVVAVPNLTQCSYEELVDASSQLMALSNAVRYQHLALIAELLGREEWKADVSGEKFYKWLVIRYQIDYHQAKAMVDCAGRFDELPAIFTSFGEGKLSWEQLVEICQYADEQNDAVIAEEAETMTLSQCRVLRRAHKNLKDRDPDKEDAPIGGIRPKDWRLRA
jgi:hypothetical protein